MSAVRSSVAPSEPAFLRLSQPKPTRDLDGILAVPPSPRGVVVFVHGSDPGRGVGAGAAAALIAAAELEERLAALVTRGGRPDLVEAAVLERVATPVLLIVGRGDEVIHVLSREALRHLHRAELAVVPGATHLFREPGALRLFAQLTSEFFERHLTKRSGLLEPVLNGEGPVGP